MTPTPERLTWFVERKHPDRLDMLQVQGPFTESASAEALERWQRERPDLRPSRWERPIAAVPKPTPEPPEILAHWVWRIVVWVWGLS